MVKGSWAENVHKPTVFNRTYDLFKRDLEDEFYFDLVCPHSEDIRRISGD